MKGKRSDYGYERRREGNCLPAFWFNPAVVSRSCSQGQKYPNSTGYRKVVSNNCVKGVKDMYTPRKQMCPNRAPKGLSLSTREGKLTADLHTNVTFLVHLDELQGMAIGLCYVFHQLLCHKKNEALKWKWQGPLHSRLGVIKANSRARRGETAGSLPATTELLYFIHCQSASITTSIFEGNWDFVSGQGVLRFGVLMDWGAAHNCQNRIPDFQTHCQNFFKSPEFPHL
nr:uncharacterized protein LOC115104401 [Oncorhynchus nerka]